MAGRNGKAGRVLAGLLGLFVALAMFSNSLKALAQALRLRAALSANPGLHLEVKEAFLTFALELTLGLAAGWWGISKFRRRKLEAGEAQ
ncbi:hypothetical protein MON38_17210 [Hymenobacter sp. DH14]|uniref:Uncharacterized protein n=1 Tax=Hymenobacter cyanobacteriorum TaxID=2926463 RepID=A0A9X1VIC5_9BACT|nr:hypothetical protein [Hymenobacter cyanobacteriorum]MCI1189165.1 hypothetical protein [Hymenobacter cyanobacteriorum]